MRLAWAFLTALSISMTITADTSIDGWGFLAVYLMIAAGYGLVLVRAFRGR